MCWLRRTEMTVWLSLCRYHVDNGGLVDGRFFRDGRHCTKAVQSLATDHFRLPGIRGQNPRCCHRKKSHISSLDWKCWVGYWRQFLTVFMAERKRQKMVRVLRNWPASRLVATARQVSELTFLFMHVSFALRPGKFSWGQMLAAVGLPRAAVFPSGSRTSYRRMVLGPMFYDDFEFWRRFVEGRMTARGGEFMLPMYNVLTRPPALRSFLDASK